MRPEPLLRGTPGSVVMPCLFSLATRYVFKGAAQFRDRSRKPTDNAFAEAFNGKVRAECIDQN